MTKRHAEQLLAIALSILDDVEAIFPADRREIDRDRSRLTSLVEVRGISVFTIDFPVVLRHLDRCLADGAFTRSGLPHTRRSRPGATIPRLFRGLYQRVFDFSGVLLPEPDINAIACLRQLYAFAKKFRIDCKKEATYAAVSDFAAVDGELPDPTLSWDQKELGSTHHYHGLRLDDERVRRAGSHQRPSGRPDVPSALLERCQRVFDIVSTTLGVFDPRVWRLKHGPGAVADRRSGEYKYTFPSWSARLETVFPYSEFAFANYTAWVDSINCVIDDRDTIPSKMVSVPKTQKGPRLIACEPTAHQWCQQALWDYFGTRCSQTWIGRFVHFRDQTFNQRAACLASKNDDHWTVDLSSASDRVSLWLVERAFQANPGLLAALHASRTRFVSQAIDNKTSHLIELKKFSTMGSACTFPVESLIFLSIAIACVLHVKGVDKVNERSILRHAEGVLVFGDDVVIPSAAGKNFEELLTYLDFKVNQSKTYRNGRFRESCGLEAFDGVDVTPAYVLRFPEARKPESVVSSVMSSNNFHWKGWWRAAEAIKKTVTVGKMLTVSAGSGIFGWKSFCCGDTNSVRRTNPHLQRDEVRGTVLKARCRRIPAEGFGPLLQYFTERPDPELSWASGAVGRPSITLRLGWVASSDVVGKT